MPRHLKKVWLHMAIKERIVLLVASIKIFCLVVKVMTVYMVNKLMIL
ncbi:hypothetical protein [Moraxella lacunata]